MWHKDHCPIAQRPRLRAPKGNYNLLLVNQASMGGEGYRGAGLDPMRGGEERRGGEEGDPASFKQLHP